MCKGCYRFVPLNHSPLEGESARQGRSPQPSRWGESATDGEPPERLRLLEPDAEGRTDAGPLNADFDSTYLNDPRNPRWIAKPTVAYLWARTVTCKQCRATLPLLKTRWLCKKDRKRVLLTMEPVVSGRWSVASDQSTPSHPGAAEGEQATGHCGFWRAERPAPKRRQRGASAWAPCRVPAPPARAAAPSRRWRISALKAAPAGWALS